MNKLNKIAITTSIGGLVLLILVLISGSSYPDPFYSYGTAIGMFMVFLSLLLYIVIWCRELYVSIKEKNAVDSLILIIALILFVIIFIRR